MEHTKIPVIRTAPRVFTILLALFLMLFSFDVFDGQSSAREMAVGFLIHNIPSILMLVIVSAAWNREWLGAVIFPVLGLLYFLNNVNAHWSVHLAITLPLLVNGLLYLLAWLDRKKNHPMVQN